jgi:oligopeptide transport system substrate-binding protein
VIRISKIWRDIIAWLPVAIAHISLVLTFGNARRLLGLTAGIILAAAVTGCGQSQSNVAAGNREAVFHYGNGAEPQALDPHVMTSSPDVNIGRALFEGLVTRHPETLEMVPGSAERWEILEDGKTYNFYINPRARWSNGDRVNAEDFAWSLRRSLHPDMGNQLAYALFAIRGAQDYASGKNHDLSSLGIEVLDELTLQITLNNPDPYFLSTLGTYPAYPVHRATVEAHGKATDRYTPWTRVENFVGNGPFTLSDWKINRRVVASRSETYWDRENVKLSAIVFHPIDNQSAEEKMFRAGQLHFTAQIPLSKIPAYQALSNSPYQQRKLQGTYFLQLNTASSPLDDPRVRRALALATDRQRIIDKVLLGTEIPNSVMVPAGTPGYQSPESLDYAPDKARALMAEAGYPDGEGWPGMEFLFNTSENHRKIAVALQQMWKDELNIKITLANQEWKVYLDTVDERDYTLSRMGWIAPDLNPATFLDIFTSDNGINRTGFSNARYDEIMLELVPPTADQQERNELMQEAEAILLDAVPVIPLYTYNSKHLVQPSVEGATPNVLDIQSFKFISLNPDTPVWTAKD